MVCLVSLAFKGHTLALLLATPLSMGKETVGPRGHNPQSPLLHCRPSAGTQGPGIHSPNSWAQGTAKWQLLGWREGSELRLEWPQCVCTKGKVLGKTRREVKSTSSFAAESSTKFKEAKRSKREPDPLGLRRVHLSRSMTEYISFNSL